MLLGMSALFLASLALTVWCLGRSGKSPSPLPQVAQSPVEDHAKQEPAPAVPAAAATTTVIAEAPSAQAEAEPAVEETPPILPPASRTPPPVPDAESDLRVADKPEACSTCTKKGTYGTSLVFADSPAEAAKQAAKENRLMFVLHISGNFEDDKFT